ncbi:hypothetical protein [Oceanobacillus bengalensis]|uniref:Uncharacterized protein n=1 Tax=Oceanobacillus bengalensis TaxID=1435466 RepID=A0A494YWH9_9BACI|nr:hypothetical protein [Oceanobacillus bengalensis]RKQ14382.1 hypothetical protein D8M05_13210 [Oceanobacillus bengalensis]
MYYYANPYVVYPHYYPRLNSLPIQYVPVQYNEHEQQTSNQRPEVQYPEVDIHQLDISARRFQALMKQADLLVDKIVEDPVFARELMSAAQKTDKSKVEELIESTGVTIKTATTFTPTGIRILLDNSEQGGDCCDLLIALRW